MKYSKPIIMGILNVTPDSFSDGGNVNGPGDALKAAERMLFDGADIIDIGGESTRPGAAYVSAEEEMRRVLPALKAIKERTDAKISVDTYKTEVAKAAIEMGADIINDVGGLNDTLNDEAGMEALIAETGAEYVLTLRGGSGAGATGNGQGGLTPLDAANKLSKKVASLLDAGVSKEKIIIDPGIGFDKTYEDNINIIKGLEYITALNMPVLLGVSRKSLIDAALGLPKSERQEATDSLNVLGYVKGCRIFRVHDVRASFRALNMAYKVLGDMDGTDSN